jgi:ABC-type multidrug transport system fused ATPase/permease subunit
MLGLADMYESLQMVAVHLKAIFGFIDKESTVVEKKHAVELAKVSGNVVFDSVSFGYKDDQPVLKGVSFEAHRGETVALVGPSGAGKTTLCDLLCRFYDPTSGAVIVDGVDLRDVTLDSLRSSIGVVLQDTALFNDTVYNNIAYARPDATEDEVRRAARIARADVFIDQLADKYESNVGERGCKLSAGQRQRIAIARAVLADPAILIFDEATCNLDAESERLVQRALRELGKTKTIFVIAHRLSTIRHADQILVVKDGEIKERGTHTSLLALGGVYASMVTEQQLGETPEQVLSPDLVCAAA